MKQTLTAGWTTAGVKNYNSESNSKGGFFMSLRKFIGSVSALAVALSAFAAMAVTADAEDYDESIAIGANDAYNIASYAPSTGIATAKTLANGAYAGIRKDLSGLTDIADASTVTVEFDTAVSSGSVVVFGFGDATTCTAMAGGGGNYKPDGRAIYFGSVDGTGYKAYDVKSGAALNIGPTAFGKVVHARITLDRDAHTYSYYIGYSATAKIEGKDISTNIDNLTYVDAYTKTSGAAFRFNNIKVSYTVPDEPVVEASVEASKAFTKAGGYDNDMVVGKLTVTVKNGSYDLKNAKYNQKHGVVTDADGNTIDATTITGDADGANALVFVVLNDVDDVTELNNVVFE